MDFRLYFKIFLIVSILMISNAQTKNSQSENSDNSQGDGPQLVNSESDTSQTESTQTDSSKSDDNSQTESPRSQDSQTNRVQTENDQSENSDNSQGDGPQLVNSESDTSQTESTQMDNSQTESPRSEDSQTNSTQTEYDQSENSENSQTNRSQTENDQSENDQSEKDQSENDEENISRGENANSVTTETRRIIDNAVGGIDQLLTNVEPNLQNRVDSIINGIIMQTSQTALGFGGIPAKITACLQTNVNGFDVFRAKLLEAYNICLTPSNSVLNAIDIRRRRPSRLSALGLSREFFNCFSAQTAGGAAEIVPILASVIQCAITR